MVGRIPCIAGDSLNIQVGTSVRLHPLRRAAGMPIVQELFAFYLPYRWYRSQYPEELVNRTTRAAETQAFDLDLSGVPALLSRTLNVPAHVPHALGAIIEHHFKQPNQSEVTAANVLTTEDDGNYGHLCWELDTWETVPNWEDSSSETSIPSEHTLAVKNIAQYTATQQMEQFRDWEAVRIEAAHDRIFGGRLNREALQVPEILMHEKTRAKEMQHSAPGSETEGQQMAQAGTSMRGRIPRKFIPEHGSIYIFTLLRIVPTFQQSELWIDTHGIQSQAAYALPQDAVKPAAAETLGNMFADTQSSTNAGYRPQNAWYRDMPDFWHPTYFNDDAGWWCRPTPDTKEALHRCKDWDDVFTSHQYGHGQAHTSIQVSGARPIDGTSSSVYMGHQQEYKPAR